MRALLPLAAMLCALTVATRAEAVPPASRVALHPPLVVGGEDERDRDLDALVTAKLAELGVSLVPAATVSEALGKLGPGGCATAADTERAACLGKLAQAVGADRALLLTIAPFAAGKVVVTSALADAQGHALPTPPPESVTRQAGAPLKDPLSTALDHLLAAIDFDAPAPTPAPTAVSTAPTAPTSSSVPPPGPTGWRRPAGLSMVALGVIGLAFGAFSFVDEGSQRAQYTSAYHTAYDAAARTGTLPSQDDLGNLHDLQGAVARRHTSGLIGTLTGVALCGGGVFLTYSSSF